MSRAPALVYALYAATVLLSACLVFVVQPIVAKLVLPGLGGSSAVWTTCMLFFQTMLLVGYLWAHLGARWLTPRTHLGVHLAIVIAAFFFLPLSITIPANAETSPILSVLIACLAGVGLPFFALSSLAPMLQYAFSMTEHPDANDPYFLYAASNFGSMIALVGYPFVLEPSIGVLSQTHLWSLAFVVLCLGFAACIRAALKVSSPTGSRSPLASHKATWRVRLGWLFCAFVPSSLMLGVTAYITTDIASVPLLWVVPLALYLLTFMLVFARRPLRMPVRLRVVLPWLVLLVLSSTMFDLPMWFKIAANLVVFFSLSMTFHSILVESRPPVEGLTEFYLWMALGGALGGVFNAVAAPLIFDRLLEYYVVVAVGLAALPTYRAYFAKEDFAPDAYRVLAPTLTVLVGGATLWSFGFLRLQSGPTILATMIALGLAAAATWWRPRFAHLAVAVSFTPCIWSVSTATGVVAQERSFFGAYRVLERSYNGHAIRKFSHGSTAHGAQSLEPEFRDEPIGYHHPESALGQALQSIPHTRVGVVGLGIGAMAAYANNSTHFDFYEIDPTVVEIARTHFSYLENCGSRCTVEIGDGRIRLSEKPRGYYDILVLDAYNSDSVPTHLLTREALSLYLDHLAEDGVLIFNVSNRFMDIESVVGALASDASLVALTQVHMPRKELRQRYVMPAAYTIVARKPETLRKFDERWRPTRTDATVWTDDYSNVLGVFRW